MTGSTETRRFAAEQVEKLIGQLAYQMSRTLKSHDPGPVHDLRVAIRRFEQLFTVFRACFPTKDVKKIRHRLKEIMAQAGALRDCDIALKLLAKSKVDAVGGLQAKVRAQRKEAERVLLGTLRRWKERKSSLKWRTRLQAVPAVAEDKLSTVEETALRKLPRMAGEFFGRGKKAAHAAGSARELHAFRITAKKFRYTLELLAPVYGPTLGGRLERIRNLQTLLGGINDYVTVREMIAESGAGALDDELKRKQRKRTRRFQRQWTKEFAGHENSQPWIDYLSASEDKRRPARKPVARSSSVGSEQPGTTAVRRQTRRA